MKIESTSVDIFLVGYVTSGAVFFTDPIDKSTTTTDSYVDVDITNDLLGSDDANGAIVEFHQTDNRRRVALRKNGASYDYYAESGHAFAPVAIDDGDIFEQKIEWDDMDLYLIGYTLTADSPTPTPTATPTATPYGSLTLDPITFPGTALNGSQQLVGDTSTNDWTVTSTYPAGTSWSVTVSSTDLTAGSYTINVSNFEIRLLDSNITPAGDKPASSITSFTPLSGTAQTLMAYSGSNGDSTFTFSPDFQLYVPASTYISLYSGTVTVTFVAGP
jgi:hypothetical protein